KSLRVTKLNFSDDKIESVITDEGNEIKTDYYISAVPFFDFKNLVGEEVYKKDFNQIDGLKSSPIVNIHLKFDSGINGIIKDRFTGILNSLVQWVFKVKDDQVCIVISSADEIVEMDKEDIIDISKKELY